MNTCPRCAAATRTSMCMSCHTDMALERAYGVQIPKELWPIANAATFEAFCNHPTSRSGA